MSLRQHSGRGKPAGGRSLVEGLAQTGSLLAVTQDNQGLTLTDDVVGTGVEDHPALDVQQADDDQVVIAPQVRVADGTIDEATAGGDPELLQHQVAVGIMEQDLHVVEDRGAQQGLCQASPADLVRRQHPIGTGPLQLAHDGLVGGTGQDVEIGIDLRPALELDLSLVDLEAPVQELVTALTAAQHPVEPEVPTPFPEVHVPFELHIEIRVPDPYVASGRCLASWPKSGFA